jgi:hypothetical protein
MPILIKRPNGEATPLINGEFLSAYYFLPKEILDKCPKELDVIPREPARAIWDKKSLAVIESDLFHLLIIDGFSWMVWPFMGSEDRKEIYSGYDPAWKLSHIPDYWIEGLIIEKIIPDSVGLVKAYAGDPVGYMPMELASAIMSKVVPAVMKRYNMYDTIKTAKEFRCFEDFDDRFSTQKIDFYRKWYHTRTKVGKMLSLESLIEDDEDGSFDVEDYNAGFEDKIISEDYFQKFKSLLTEKDMKILEMRMNSFTYEEIAEKLGYKNHSGVIKRMRFIKEEFLKYESSI